MKQILTTGSPEETQQVGQRLGASLKGDELILLSGDLGAGKTLFTKGLAQAMDLDPQDVVSPTFTLMNRFDGRFKLYHIDLYRLGETICGSLPEIDDYLGEGVIVIEWAQYLSPDYFNLTKAIKIQFNVTTDDTRSIEISSQLDYIDIDI